MVVATPSARPDAAVPASEPPSRAREGELARRVGVALVAVPAALALARAGGWYLAGALALLAGGGALEVYRVAEHRGVRPFAWLGAAAAAALPLAAAVDPRPGGAAARLWAVAMALLLAGAALAPWRRGREARPLECVAVTTAGALYTGGTLAFAVLLRGLPSAPGFALLMFPAAVVWAADTAAYTAGRRLGSRRLAPAVSPGKTVEGAAAGLVAALAAGAAYPLLVPAFARWAAVPVWATAAAGLALALAGLAGDLAKSAWKREAGVKDSGAVFPGHGGIVDRLDSLFFALPAAYGLALLAGG